MRERVYTVKELEWNLKKTRAKVWFTTKANNAIKWISDNKEIIIFVGPALLGATTTLVRVGGKQLKLKKEENIKNLYCYDRSLGHYWRLKRELSNAEWVNIDKRKRNGERLADILDELKVLK